ncbi:phage antirepressor KilAC domain-containing protein [Hydrogenophaga atypica]|uniref:Phage antirepressor KilAC domain-containing protein n=1 Tax=Hydrogenophaga atypica TaxID=249409 RepID=A0ABW2QVP6_9BURK
MTSKEMADLTEKRHDSVKRTIDTLAEKGVISYPQVVDGEKSANGVVEKLYRIGKRDSYIIVAQLSPEFTARLVDRWQELEADAADPMKALNDPAKLRHVLLGYTEKVLALESRVDALTPKAEALDRLETASDGSFCLNDAAKALQVPPRKFTARLQQMGWIYRRPMGSTWLAYQDRLKMGVMEHKVVTGEKSDGTEWVSTQARVTAKGMARLALLIGGEQVDSCTQPKAGKQAAATGG